MDQLTSPEPEYNNKRHKTCREKFLEQMDQLLPWKRLEKKIKPYYPSYGQGRQPYPMPTLLHIHCMQLFYHLSDPAMEDALCEIEYMRRSAGLRLSDRLPDETTTLNFRHLIKRHDLGKKLFGEVNRHLKSEGRMLREGSIVDATIISATTSTKNKSGKRDPEMHQVKKGNEWHFGMKMHIGVDYALGLIHSVSTTAPSAHVITQADQFLYGEEQRCRETRGVGVLRNAQSIRSATSSGCSAMTKSDIAVWRKMASGYTCLQPSPIWW
jgi:transposase, IS5 family